MAKAAATCPAARIQTTHSLSLARSGSVCLRAASYILLPRALREIHCLVARNSNLVDSCPSRAYIDRAGANHLMSKWPSEWNSLLASQ